MVTVNDPVTDDDPVTADDPVIADDPVSVWRPVSVENFSPFYFNARVVLHVAAVIISVLFYAPPRDRNSCRYPSTTNGGNGVGVKSCACVCERARECVCVCVCMRARACCSVSWWKGERNRRGHRPQPPSQLYFVTVFHWGRPAPAGRLNDKKFVFPVISPLVSHRPRLPGVAALIFLGYPAKQSMNPRCAREKTTKNAYNFALSIRRFLTVPSSFQTT